MQDRLLVGTRKGFFAIARHNGSWDVERAQLLGDPVTMLLARADGSVLVAQDMGHFGVKLKRSTDGGASWHERPAPTYPPKPADVEDVDHGRGTPIPWSLKTVWSLAAGAAPNELWCGTIPGALFRSRDGGETWSIVESLWNHPDRKQWAGGGADFPGIHSILIDPRDPKTIRIGVSVGGLWTSRDDGETWEVEGVGMRAEYMPPEMSMLPGAQDPHCIVQCPAAPDHLWIQHHNGIFKSSDAGRTCTEIKNVSPSVFGFPVAVHPKDPNVAWFVPGEKDEKRYAKNGEVVVTRTRDGGETFETLREGLPQKHAYDIVYRHALDVDDSGERLAFGSTTGNLWVSEDQGDSWAQVSGNLPPVYCVRFA
jgi:hypothetical protein